MRRSVGDGGANVRAMHAGGGNVGVIHELPLHGVLPAGWVWKIIDDIAEVNPRIDKSRIPDNLSVSFVPMPAVGAGSGYIDVSEKKSFLKVKKGFTSFKEGDVLFAKITPCMENGKMAVVPKVSNGYGFGSTEFHVLRPKEGIDVHYLYYYVSSKTFRGEAERYMTGAVGQKRVSTTYLKESKIPVANPTEQKLIVSEIEKQFSRLDEAVAALKRIKANLKRYKASVLKAAVEGKLSEEWRKEHPDVEPASKFLKRILVERRKKWEEDNPKKKYKEPKRPKTNMLNIPTTWTWSGIEETSLHIVDCLHSTAKFSESGKYCIDTNCMGEGFIPFEKARFVSDATYEERIRRLKPKENDILFSREGTIGLTALVPPDKDLCLGQRMMMFRIDSGILPKFVMWVLLSPLFIAQWKPKVMGTTSPHVNIGDIRLMAIPLPPMEEQHIIVQELEGRLTVIDTIERELEINLTRANRLRQSILKKAFSGKLLPQEVGAK